MVVDFSKETNWYAYHVIYFVLSLRKAQLIYRLAVSKEMNSVDSPLFVGSFLSPTRAEEGF